MPAGARPAGWRWLLREPAPAAGLTRLRSYPWLVVATVCVGVFMGP